MRTVRIVFKISLTNAAMENSSTRYAMSFQDSREQSKDAKNNLRRQQIMSSDPSSRDRCGMQRPQRLHSASFLPFKIYQLRTKDSGFRVEKLYTVLL
jgi:hypothetical protein